MTHEEALQVAFDQLVLIKDEIRRIEAYLGMEVSPKFDEKPTDSQ